MAQQVLIGQRIGNLGLIEMFAFISNKNWDSGGNPGFVVNTQGDGMKWNLRDNLSGRRDSPHVAPQLEDHAFHHIAVTFHRTGNGTIAFTQAGPLACTAS